MKRVAPQANYEGQVATGTICKLKKALYELNQSSSAWLGRFTKVMTSRVQKKVKGITLFIKHSVLGEATVLVYVDDIIVSGDDKREQQMLSQCLVTEF